MLNVVQHLQNKFLESHIDGTEKLKCANFTGLRQNFISDHYNALILQILSKQAKYMSTHRKRHHLIWFSIH